MAGWIMRAAPSATASARAARRAGSRRARTPSAPPGPPAATTPVLNVMLLPAMICSPSPPAPANTASVASPTVLVVAIRRPATMSGIASGSSTRHSSWRSVSPMPRPASLASSGTFCSPSDDVAEDDLQRVGGERDDRRGVAPAGDRQQQEEHRQARQRVEHAGEPDDRPDQPPAAARDQRRARRRSRSRSRPTSDQVQVLRAAGPCSGRSCRRSSPGRACSARCSCASRAVADLDLRQHRRSGREVASGLHALGRRASRACVASGELRNSEMISTDSTPTTAPRPSTTGPYWVSDRSRSDSASRSTSSSSRIGSGAVSGLSGTVSRAMSRSDIQPSGRPSASTTSG